MSVNSHDRFEGTPEPLSMLDRFVELLTGWSVMARIHVWKGLTLIYRERYSARSIIVNAKQAGSCTSETVNEDFSQAIRWIRRDLDETPPVTVKKEPRFTFKSEWRTILDSLRQENRRIFKKERIEIYVIYEGELRLGYLLRFELDDVQLDYHMTLGMIRTLDNELDQACEWARINRSERGFDPALIANP